MVESLLYHMTESGCSPFFVTSAISSLGFGEMVRQCQLEQLDENIAFKEKMLQLKNDFSEEQFNDQINFRKASYEFGRKCQALVMQDLNDKRQDKVEFHYFCEKCWPLSIDVRTILKWQKDILKQNGIIPMKVLIAKTNVNTCKKQNGCYENFCSQLAKTAIPNLSIEHAAWKDKCQSPMAESLNINYIMQGIPTLVIYPYKIKDIYHLEFATWSFNRGVGAMMLDKAVTFPCSLERIETPEIMQSIEAVAGVVRDNYMVLEYQKPAVYPTLMKPEVLRNRQIAEFLRRQYCILEQTVNVSKDFRQLCLEADLQAIELSLSVNRKLLES